MKETKTHWIIKTSQGYKSLCGAFDISDTHRYGIFYIKDRVKGCGTVEPNEVTCKSCKYSLKAKEEDISIRMTQHILRYLFELEHR